MRSPRSARFALSIATLALGALVATGCGSSGSSVADIPSNAFCVVNGHALPTSDYTTIVDQAVRNLTAQGQSAPEEGTTEYDQLSTQAVDYLVQEELFEEQAKDLGVSVSAYDVDSQFQQLLTSYFQGNEYAYQQELQAQGVTDAQVKDRIKQQVLSQKLFERVTKGVTVSDSEAKANYDQNPAQYQQKASRTVAHILVKANQKALADKIYDQVKGGDQKLFAKLAKQYSQDQGSASQGGVLTINQGETVPQFDKVAFQLKTGQTSEPVKTQYGWHVIQARTDVTPAKQQSFDDVKDQIKSNLLQTERTTDMQNWQTTLFKKAESHVSCRDGYKWSQTATNTTATAVDTSTDASAGVVTDTVPTTAADETSTTSSTSEDAGTTTGATSSTETTETTSATS